LQNILIIVKYEDIEMKKILEKLDPTSDSQNGFCRVESIVTVDERGQMVLPKDVREKAGIKAGDKLAITSWCEKGEICCLSLMKADSLTGMVKQLLGPVMKEILSNDSENSGSKNYFEDVADKWDDMRSVFFPDNVKEKAIEAANVQPGNLAADIGAGTGFITEGLLKKGLKVIAIDQSDAMLSEMKKKFSFSENIDYRIGDSDNLPIKDSSLDFAFANMYLHHVENPAQAIKEMARTLKPGGKLVITDADEHNQKFLIEEHHDRWLGFKREDVEKWFKEAGLKDVKVDSIGERCSCSSGCGSSSLDISIFLAIGTK
jgi:AbrB family looped-hinge helix DNA binding protein